MSKNKGRNTKTKLLKTNHWHELQNLEKFNNKKYILCLRFSSFVTKAGN